MPNLATNPKDNVFIPRTISGLPVMNFTRENTGNGTPRSTGRVHPTGPCRRSVTASSRQRDRTVPALSAWQLGSKNCDNRCGDVVFGRDQLNIVTNRKIGVCPFFRHTNRCAPRTPVWGSDRRHSVRGVVLQAFRFEPQVNEHGIGGSTLGSDTLAAALGSLPRAHQKCRESTP